MASNYQVVIDKTFLLLGGSVDKQKIRKVINVMGEILKEKALENEPVKFKGFGTFGVYSYKVDYVGTVLGQKRFVARKGKTAYKPDKVMQAGATHCKLVFKPCRTFREVFN